MAKKVGSIIVIVIVGIFVMAGLRLGYVSLKCDTIRTGEGAGQYFFKGCSKKDQENAAKQSTWGGKKKCKQKKRRNKKY
jgi:hypothetical protein